MTKDKELLPTTDKFLSAVAYLGADAAAHYSAALVCQAEAKRHLEEAVKSALSISKEKTKVTA